MSLRTGHLTTLAPAILRSALVRVLSAGLRGATLGPECCKSSPRESFGQTYKYIYYQMLAVIFMSRKFKIRDQEAVHFVTFTIIQWLDVFIRLEYRDVSLDSTQCLVRVLSAGLRGETLGPKIM